MTGAPTSLKSLLTTLLCKPDLPLGTATIQPESLNTMGVIGSQGGRGQLAAFSCQSKVGIVTIMNNRIKAAIGKV